MSVPSADFVAAGTPHAGTDASHVSHAGFIVGEALLLVATILLSFLVIRQPGPLPGDVGGVVAVQHAFLPHHVATTILEWVSTINWPVPAGAALAAIVGLLLLLRRWLDAIVVFCSSGLADASNFLLALLVHRPRPSGDWIIVLQHVTATTSYPSGHVVHAIAFLGILVFLSLQTRRVAWLLWPLRVVFVAVILLMGPSRLLEGEHWPTDVLAGAFVGTFWLVLGIHAFLWAAGRHPRLLAGDEHEELEDSGRVPPPGGGGTSGGDATHRAPHAA